MKTVWPSSSYKIVVPDDIKEQTDARVASFWVSGEPLLLQLSSYQRAKGSVISAKERLKERMEKTPAKWTRIEPDLCVDPIVDQAAAGQLQDGLTWLHAYFVWPHLTVYATISGPAQEVNDPNSWARMALRKLALSIH